jgi:RNase P/RNase MRP subunit POP5
MAAKLNPQPLSPTLKEKKRYLTYHLHSEEALPRSAGHLLIQELKSILGTFGAAKAGLLPITFDETSGKGVLRTSLAAVDETRAALLLITNVGKSRVVVEPLLASGTIRKTRPLFQGS